MPEPYHCVLMTVLQVLAGAGGAAVLWRGLVLWIRGCLAPDHCHHCHHEQKEQDR